MPVRKQAAVPETRKPVVPKVKNGKRIDTYGLRLDGGVRALVYVFLVKKAFRDDSFVLACPEFDITEAGTDLAATKKKVQEIAEQRGAVTWEDYLEVDLGFDTDPHWGLAHEQKGGPLPARLSLGTTVWEIMQTRSGLRRGRHKGYNNVNSAPVPKTAEGEMTLVVRDTPETRAGLAALHRRITVFAADLFKELAQADTEAVLARYAREAAETLAVPDAPAAKKPKRRTTR